MPRIVLVLVAFPVLLFPGPGASAAPERAITPLGTLSPVSARQAWGSLRVDRSVTGGRLQVGDRTFDRGIGTHASSELVYDLDEDYDRFEAWVGIDAAMRSYKEASVVFVVLGDGRELFHSGVMHADTPAAHVSIPVGGVRQLKLVVGDSGDGHNCDHADWADAVLVSEHAARVAALPIAATVVSPSVSVQLAADGQIVALEVNRKAIPVRGGTRVAGMRTAGPVAETRLRGGGMSFRRELTDPRGHRCVIIETFTPTNSSVRWDLELRAEGEPWTVPVETWLSCDRPAEARFWTGWSDPEMQGEVWHDPLVPLAFEDRHWLYGNVAQSTPVCGDFIAIPLASILFPDSDRGVSLVQSPEDVLLNLTLGISKAGRVRFSRRHHRLDEGKPVRFSLDLAGHEAGWRGGLRWMATRYPAFFDPPNPRVHRMAGCGAYSGDERPIDANKYRGMAFRINWKLSDDFPYMGYFLPPVKSPEERWERSCDEPAPPGKGPTMSCAQMNAYGRRMHEQGFHVLNYFNVTEFGKSMQLAPGAVTNRGAPDVWKDPRAFLRDRLPTAAIRPPILTCYNALVVDVGDPEYRRFMLDQARRHIELLPDTDGLCIDRLDWLRLDNPGADDGVSWVDGRPVRSLLQSWKGFMDELGPMMHSADKVLFANTMTMRLDLNRHLDGIYAEQGDNPGALNAVALMGIRKPVLVWSNNDGLKNPGIETFFQRHLYLGVFPTAPYPFNHHCITPDPISEKAYLDYGPLLDAMRGRTWILDARSVESSTSDVKVNVFRVPDGYAIPVTFGGKASSASLSVRGIASLERLKADVIHPGDGTARPLATSLSRGVLGLEVPLVRGCAMVRLRSSGTSH